MAMKTVGLSSKLKSPVAAAVLAGFEVAGTAVAFGVAETILGVAAACCAYRALDRNRATAGEAPAGAAISEKEEEEAAAESRGVGSTRP
jgi:hypothetical protein